MGLFTSKQIDKPEMEEKEKGDKRQKYSVIISGNKQPSDNYKIQILFNEKIASSAIDSLKSSQDFANAIAKKLVLDALQDKNTPAKFGEFLLYIFASESTLTSTRDLVYWSLELDGTILPCKNQSKQALQIWKQSIGKSQIVGISQNWIVSPITRKQVICPLLEWTIQNNKTFTKTLSTVVANSLPYTKQSTVSGLTYVATESLKSPEVKVIVKKGLIQYLKAATTESKDEENKSNIP